MGDRIPRSPDLLFHFLPPSAPHLDLDGAQSGAPIWVSVCIAIHRRMKVPSGLAFFAHVLFPSPSRLDLGS